MKRVICLLFFAIISVSSYSQVQVSDKQMNNLITKLKASNFSEDQIKNAVNGIINNPELYNNLWKNFMDQAFIEDSKWSFLKDLNIQFKTFEETDSTDDATDNGTSLGFTYDFNFDYAKFKESSKKNSRTSYSFGFTAKGNVAFNKKNNPADFLETKLDYNLSKFIGGVVKTKDTTVTNKIYSLVNKLVNIKDMQSDEAVKLWEELGGSLVLSNQYYYSLSPKFAFESNQDFSTKQFTPGLGIDLGVKAWNKDDILAKLNVLDYPFALLRLLFGTDQKFTPYGSTLPTVQFVFDYVVPSKDDTRESLVGDLDPFPRMKFETGFRTIITRIKKENIFFNANYRYYYEIDAPQEIVDADLEAHSYFVMALQSTSGFYVSYANGKLPFDAKSDEIYSLGFNYKFN